MFFKESSDFTKVPNSGYMEGAEPFEYITPTNDKAILFIHGFPGSPKMYYMVRELAIKNGYDVFIPALPGFGTKKEDFIYSNFSMWFNFIKNYYMDKRVKYKRFYIVGTSMGGSITLKLAEEFSGDSSYEPTAIASVAAPVFLNSLFRGVVKSPLLYFIRTIARFISYIPPKEPVKDPSLDEDGECEWVGYYGLFPKQIKSFMFALKTIKRELNKITVPCFLIHAKEDKTVSFKSLPVIFKNIKSDKILLRVISLKKWKHSNHSLFIYKSVVNPLWSDIEYFFNGID
ncbi:MAG: alpha/beta fold hydrolase [Spirochaetales bacterium]|nr:alpha/beta fold hydrolase [Spirochaetales bacterium]